jgi:hypothetical protein
MICLREMDCGMCAVVNSVYLPFMITISIFPAGYLSGFGGSRALSGVWIMDLLDGLSWSVQPIKRLCTAKNRITGRAAYGAMVF